MKKWILLIVIALISLGAYVALVTFKFKYPDLNKCFNASVSKVLLCSKSPEYTKLKNISVYFLEAVVASEDDKFYLHSGFDWKELKNSVMKNLRKFSFARGGSTITQQLVKNVYLNHEKSITRKIKEAVIANELEKKYKKDLILEKYVNAIEFGVNIWGIKKASRHYFKTDPGSLGVLESLYLVTLLPSPRRYSKSFAKSELTPYLKKRILSLIDRLVRKKVIEKDYADALKDEVDDFPWNKNDFDDFSDFGSIE